MAKTENRPKNNLVGREFTLIYGTRVRVMERLGIYYRVKNLDAGHTTNYEAADFHKDIKSETKDSLIKRYVRAIT